MKKLILTLLQVQILADGGAVLITKASKENPSANGVHKVSRGQFQRIVTRCIGVFNPIGFKHIVTVCNGSAKLVIDVQECKAGDAWENKVTNETGTYTKDWIKYQNHEVELGLVGSMKLAELSLSASFAQSAEMYANTVSPKAVKVVVETTEEHSAETTDNKSEEPTV